MSGRPPKILRKIAEDVETALAHIIACEQDAFNMSQSLTDLIFASARGRVQPGDIKQIVHTFTAICRNLETVRGDLKAANQLIDVLRTEQQLLFPKGKG